MDANRTTLAFHEESVWGTTPACAFTKIRFTGESLNFNIQNITSNEIRDDRQVTDLIQTGADASGGINFELSYGALDVMLRGAFASDWVGVGNSAEVITAGASALNFVTDSSAKTITLGASVVHNIIPGCVIKLEGMGTNDGFKFVTAVAGNVITVDSLAVSTTYTATATIKGAYMKNGLAKRSYSIERKVDMPTGDDYFFIYRGMMVNTLSLSVSSGAVVTGSMDFIGKEAAAKTATYASTGTYVEAATGNVLNAVSNVGQIMEGATLAAIAGVYFREISLTLSNNLRGRPAIGVLGNFDVGQGKVDVSGSITAYFANKNLYDKYVNGTESGIAFKIKEGAHATVAGKGYFFVLPRVKFSSDAINAEGTDTDITEKLNFTAIRHATYGYTAMACRFAS